ncbi:MAG TPA: Sir2 family NAD-dependent protein deacetylase [Nocardioidaceae bacterium]|nr:Sir2 family NAD-dependent protein deacetylase [Nocardioidaceae bacterium]
MSDPVEQLAGLLTASRRVTAFTGAGVSTESGIPDFRSPGGVWTRYDPRDFTFDRYVESAEVRASSWAMRQEFFARAVRPNPAHRAIARIEAAGRGHGVVTQNIDGLHQLAGSTNVVEIHGTAREVMCIGHAPRHGTPDGCGFTAPYTWAFEQLAAGDPDPSCPRCGGLVKSSTVSFGQVLFPGVVERATMLATTADLMLAVGSSLQVWPAADLPVWATRAGVPLVIVNDEPTPLDDLATVVVRGRAGEVLPAAVDSVL